MRALAKNEHQGSQWSKLFLKNGTAEWLLRPVVSIDGVELSLYMLGVGIGMLRDTDSVNIGVVLEKIRAVQRYLRGEV